MTPRKIVKIMVIALLCMGAIVFFTSCKKDVQAVKSQPVTYNVRIQGIDLDGSLTYSAQAIFKN